MIHGDNICLKLFGILINTQITLCSIGLNDVRLVPGVDVAKNNLCCSTVSVA